MAEWLQELHPQHWLLCAKGECPLVPGLVKPFSVWGEGASPLSPQALARGALSVCPRSQGWGLVASDVRTEIKWQR